MYCARHNINFRGISVYSLKIVWINYKHVLERDIKPFSLSLADWNTPLVRRIWDIDKFVCFCVVLPPTPNPRPYISQSTAICPHSNFQPCRHGLPMSTCCCRCRNHVAGPRGPGLAGREGDGVRSGPLVGNVLVTWPGPRQSHCPPLDDMSSYIFLHAAHTAERCEDRLINPTEYSEHRPSYDSICQA